MGTARKQAGKVVDAVVQKTDTMLQAIEDFSDQLTEWEVGFLDSIQNRFYKEGVKLTDKQYEHLEKIYRRFY